MKPDLTNRPADPLTVCRYGAHLLVLASCGLGSLMGCAAGGGAAGGAAQDIASPGDEDEDQTNVGVPAVPDDLPDIRNARLAVVDDYAYALQGDPVLDLDPIAASAFDLVVIDYSEDGSEDDEFSPADIAAVKDGGNRIALAYMSIGEAEVYRFYFDHAWITPDPDDNPDGPFELTEQAPSFLAPENPDWPGNLKVRYWDPAWQELIVSNPGGNPYLGDQPSYLDRIVDAGFDGVYLDIVDAYEYFGPSEINEESLEERRDAAALMIELVRSIKQHAEDYGGREFFVVPQNAPGIIADEAFPPDTVPAGQTSASYAAQMRGLYFEAIDGIGAEDTFYYGDQDEDNPFNPQTEVIEWLDHFRAEGLLVLAIDYLTDPEMVADFYDLARERGWVPYASTRDLAELTSNSGQEPD